MRALVAWLVAASCLVAGREFSSAALVFAGTVATVVFVRGVARARATLWVVPVLASSAITGFRGAAVVFGGWPRFVVAMTIAAIIGWATLFVDRVLVRRVEGLAGTLAFPAVRVPVEFALSLAGPFSTWGSLAALFGAWPDVAQLAALGGVPLVSAVLSWLASLLAAAMLAEPPRTRRSHVIAAAVTAFVVVAAGRARATLAPAHATVRVAMVTLPQSPFEGIAALRDGRVDPAAGALLASAVARATDTLFTLSARAADSGARIIAWAEENAAVLADDEPALVARAARFARERGVYLAIAYAAVDPRRARPVDNQLRLLTPQGTTAWQYRKHHPVADEVTTMLIGADTVPVADTEYGRIAGVICYDTDFPRDLRRNLGARADLLLAPSNDWAGITTVRGINTRYRALESGVTLIRPASHGVSEAIDPWGRPLAVGDYGDGDAILMAQVPVRGGVATWYGRLGDLAPAACALALVLLAVRARRTR